MLEGAVLENFRKVGGVKLTSESNVKSGIPLVSGVDDFWDVEGSGGSEPVSRVSV